MWLMALRNATRNGARSGLTALTVCVGTALLTVSMAWLTGIFEETLSMAAEPVGHARVVTEGWAAREDLFPLHEHLAGADALAATLAAHPGVVAAHPRLQVPVVLSVGEELGDVRGLATGAPLAWMTERLELDTHVAAGRMFDEDGDGVVLGAGLAARLDASVGDELVVLGLTQDGSLSPLAAPIVGIAHAGNALVDQGVFLPLERVQWLADVGDGATEVLVYGADRDRDQRLARAIADLAPAGTVVQPWSQREPWSAMLSLIAFTRRVVRAIIVFVTALGVWNTMMMSVLERQTEIGVLRAMGLTRRGVVGLFVLEALGIAIAGGLLGALLGTGGALWLEVHGMAFGERVTQNLPIPVATHVYAELRPSMPLTAFGLGLLMAGLGSAVPAWRAAAVQPVEAIRANR